MQSIESCWYDFGIPKEQIEDQGLSPREVLEQYGDVISSSETTCQRLTYMQFECTANGIDMYYCYGTGTYHFTPTN